MTPAQKDDGPASRGYGQGYEYFAMALTLVVTILLFGAAGWFLDGLLHNRPLLAIIGAFVGGFAGFMRIYYRVKADTAAKGGAANTAAKGGEGRRKGGEGGMAPRCRPCWSVVVWRRSRRSGQYCCCGRRCGRRTLSSWRAG